MRISNIDLLNTRIEVLKNNIYDLAKKKNTLLDKEIIFLSKMLDTLIIENQKLLNKNFYSQ